jgi:polyisoprenoid-binding protein YceI
MKRFCLVLAFSILCSPLLGYGQTGLTFSPESTIEVNGTSNKSDFKITAHQFSGAVSLEDGVPVSALLVISVSEMKSGRSMIMDRLMKGAFNVDENPDITFTMVSADLVEGTTFDVQGTLTMAGVTNPVTLRLTSAQNEEGATVFSGTSDLNMRDYEMDPPSAMFGALLTKPEVQIAFNLVLMP